MTREEILKAADEAVKMYREIFDTYPTNYALEALIECAILHYEKIVERDLNRYNSLFELQKKGREPIELAFVHNELLESKDVLIELKSRL